MSVKIKRILSVIIFLAIVAGLYHAANVMLFEKQHFGTAKNIAYEEPETIDVFFIGASHIFYGINPMEIWSRSGIAGYNLTTHQQPLWSSRLLLQHALKHQHPKLIVLDVLMATNFARPVLGTDQGTNMTHLALDPVPLTLQKIKGVLETDSITEKGEILFPIIMSHSRLQQGLLSFDDFHFFSGDRSHPMKGYNYTEYALSFERPEVPDADLTFELPGDMEAVLIDFIKFCQKEKLPLLLIKTPLFGNDELYKQINHIGKIAEKYEVPFVDFNHLYDEIGMNFSEDLADSGHLNVHGAEKVSAYLSDYLAAHYELPDHRGDPSYEGWEKASRHFDALVHLRESDNITDHLKAASDPNLLTVVLIGGALAEPLSLPADVLETAQTAGLSKLPETVGEGTYYAVINGGKLIAEKADRSGIQEYEFMVKDTRFLLHVSSREPDGGSYMTALHIGNGGSFSFEPGMLVVTYDMDRMERVDAVRYAFDDSFAVNHID